MKVFEENISGIFSI